MALRRNIIANYVGQGWTAVMGLAFIPLYIKYLGIEAYGLIGVLAVMQAWLALLDMGMNPTLNREMAKFTAGAHTSQSIRNLLRSLEMLCFGLAVVIAVSVWMLSPWLVTNWLQVRKLPLQQVTQAIAIIGLVVALRFVEGVYRGAILGLQKQVWLNVIGAALATFRWAGAAVIVVWFSSTIEAFFLWQGLVSIITIVLFFWMTHGSIPSDGNKARFSIDALKDVGRFASGMMLTALLVILLTQVDKVLLSKLLSLEAFGYYTLAGLLAGALNQLVSPITQALYPRLTELVFKEDEQNLISVYHRGAQMVSIALIPVGLLMLLFSNEILMLWTGDAGLCKNVSPILELLAVGAILNGLMQVPYMLQLSYGCPGFAARVNLIAITFLIPGILWAVPRYGAIGAAWAWVLLNAGYVTIGMYFMHRKFLTTEKWNWYGKDILFPMLGALTVMLMSRMAYPSDISKVFSLVWLGSTLLSAFVVSIFIVPNMRSHAINIISSGKRRAI